MQPPNGYRKPKPPRPRAPRIEVEHSILCFLLGDVAVARDDHIKSSRLRFQIKIPKAVQHIDRDAAGFENIRERNIFRPGVAIYVAPNRSNRRNLSQLFEDHRVANVPGMNDVIGTAQRCDRLRTKHAMSIGNNSDK